MTATMEKRKTASGTAPRLPTCGGCGSRRWIRETTRVKREAVGNPDASLPVQEATVYKCYDCGKKAPLATAAELRKADG